MPNVTEFKRKKTKKKFKTPKISFIRWNLEVMNVMVVHVPPRCGKSIVIQVWTYTRKNAGTPSIVKKCSKQWGGGSSYK